ncbi:hypothetical protein FRC12_011148 [Ceratobasidium sp. 428]|nr:hypothetical protein FRC12_011148 [Ceratobasidium sp. 428]
MSAATSSPPSSPGSATVPPAPAFAPTSPALASEAAPAPTGVSIPAFSSRLTLAPAPTSITGVVARPVPTSRPTLPFALAPTATLAPLPAPASTSAPGLPYSSGSVPTPDPSPPYTPPSVPEFTTANSPASLSGFANYRMLTHRGSPYSGGLAKMSISPSGGIILISTGSEGRNCFTLTKVPELNLHTVVNTGSVLATTVSWVTDEDYYIGFSDGSAYRAYHDPAVAPEEPNRFRLTRVVISDDKCAPSAITAIAFNVVSGYLAISTSRSVRILQRRDYDPTRFDWRITNGSNEYRDIAVVQPFVKPNPNINSLAFYGLSRINLIIWGSLGLVAYSMHLNEPRIIAAVYDYPISQLGISPDGRILGAVTSDGRVVHWGLALTGPLLHLSVVTTLPSCAHSPPSAVPSISITSTTAIVGTSPGGQFFFIKPSTRDRFAGRIDDRNIEVKAVVAHGERFYLAGVKGPADSIEIVAYSSNRIDFRLGENLLRQPRVFDPCHNFLSELIDEPSQTPPAEARLLEAAPPEATVSEPLSSYTRYFRSMVLVFQRLLIFFAFIVAAVSLRGIVRWLVASLMNFLTGLEGCAPMHSGSVYPPMIRYDALSYVIKQVAYVVHIMRFSFMFVARLLEYM